MTLPNYSAHASHWSIDSNVVYLNHGSFGATPSAVLAKQRTYQDAMEHQAIDYFIQQLPNLIQESKSCLAQYVGTSNHNIIFTPNTTTGVNTILNSLTANAGDHWLNTNHGYGACNRAFAHYAHKQRCVLDTVIIDYPITDASHILTAIEAAITPHTTTALIDYITSASAIIFPIAEIIALLHSKGIQVIVDAAHAPGMVPFAIDELKPDYLVANCHKWLCSPKGSAFVYVAPQHQEHIHPLIISHYNDVAPTSPMHWSNQYMWDGTHDYSAYIAVQHAINYLPTILGTGWLGVMNHNKSLALQGATIIANKLSVALPAPDHMLGSIINIPLPQGIVGDYAFHSTTQFKDMLLSKYGIEVPINFFPVAPTQWLRISAQLYNSIAQYEYLAHCLLAEL